MALSQNENQQIDLNKIYGLDSCGASGCGIRNTSQVLPSLEQIASYVGGQQPAANQAQAQGESEQFSSSSPIQGDVSQMYQPITQAQADLYPTPAVVAKENLGEIGGDTSDSTAVPDNLSLVDAITDFSNPYPVTRQSIQYLNGFIRTQIGRRVTIDFLIGSNTIQSKSGYLLAVAANYILINELDTNDVTACDFYNIKFIRFYY